MQFAHDVMRTIDFWKFSMYDVIEHSNVACLEYIYPILLPKFRPGDVEYSFCDSAAYLGKLEQLIYLHKMGCVIGFGAVSHASHGNMECFKYVCHHIKTNYSSEYNENATHSYNIRLYDLLLASHNGICDERMLEMVKYLFAHDANTHTPQLCSYAARNNWVKCLDFFIQQGFEYGEYEFTEAIKYGSLECVQYFHEIYCAHSNEMCTIAARYGQLECLIYLREHGYYWDAETCICATRKASLLPCLKYAISNGCPYTPDVLCVAQQYNIPCIIKYLQSL
jgi:hypothetical protein